MDWRSANPLSSSACIPLSQRGILVALGIVVRREAAGRRSSCPPTTAAAGSDRPAAKASQRHARPINETGADVA